MLKLVEIARSWINAANPTQQQREIAEYRISICNTCPNKKYYKPFDTYVCGLCNCPLEGKIFTPLPGDQSCPDKRWKK